jgi:hypothetical protein
MPKHYRKIAKFKKKDLEKDPFRTLTFIRLKETLCASAAASAASKYP